MKETTTQPIEQQRPSRGQRITVLVLLGLLIVVLLALWAIVSAQSRPARMVRETPEWITTGARWVRIGAIVVAGLIGLSLAGNFAGRIGRGLTATFDAVYSRWRTYRQDAVTLRAAEQARKLNDIRPIYPDEHGRLPLLYGENGILRDPNNLRAFTLQAVRETWPALEHIDAVTRAVIGAGGWPAAATADRLLPEAGPGEALMPQPTTLDMLLKKYAFKPSLTNVLIGEYTDDQTNTVKPLILSIPHSVHVLCTGASGQGKSTLLEAIALQLVGLTGVELAAIDYGSGTFDAMESGLAWPIADTPDLAVALLQELLKLCEERKELYKAVGRVRSLDQYNTLAGARLPFVAAFADETSALLEHAGTKEPFIELARVGRKYGVGLILGGTDFKATTLPSEARSNCQARIAFWLEPGLSQSLLNCRDASELGDHEIAVKRPGYRGTVRGLPPNVTEDSYRRLPSRTRAALGLPVVEATASSNGNGAGALDLDEIDDPTLPNAERAHLLHEAGASDTAIAGRLWHPTTFYINKVRTLLADPVVAEVPGHNNNNNNKDGADFCDFCGRSVDDAPRGVTFSTCAGCGVGVCSDCEAGGLCPDCGEGA